MKETSHYKARRAAWTSWTAIGAVLSVMAATAWYSTESASTPSSPIRSVTFELQDGSISVRGSPDVSTTTSQSSYTAITNVSCPTSGSCIGFGTHVEGFAISDHGIDRTHEHVNKVAESYSSGTWRLIPDPFRLNPREGLPVGVTCTQKQFCIAVDIPVQSGQLAQSFEYNGSFWNKIGLPNTINSRPGDLRIFAIACTGVHFCSLAGEGPQGGGIIALLHRDQWNEIQPPSAPLEVGSITGTSCPRIGECLFTAITGDSSHNRFVPAVDIFQDGEWTQVMIQSMYGVPVDLACPSVSWCMTLVQSPIGPDHHLGFAVIEDSRSGWKATVGSTSSGLGFATVSLSVSGLGCFKDESCILTGFSGNVPILATFRDGQWRNLSGHLPRRYRDGDLTALSCVSRNWCLITGLFRLF